MEEKTKTIWEKLAEPMEYKTYDKPLKKTGGTVTLAYIDARQVMDRLDEVVGAEFWQSDFKEVKGNIYAGIGIYLGSLNQWVWKWDVGTIGTEDFEEEKTEASDSFKRAAVKWGIGRFLYDIKTSPSAPQKPTGVQEKIAEMLESKNANPLPFEEKKPTWSTEPTDKLCSECGSQMNKKTNNETGQSFLGCSNYPKCKHTESIAEDDYDNWTMQGSEMAK